MEDAPKTKRGRPPKPADERRGPNITFRTPGGLRDRLEKAAASSGRSISEEVVHRLEHSFERQSLLVDALALVYGKEWAGVLTRLQDVGVLAPSVKLEIMRRTAGLLDQIPDAPERKRESQTTEQMLEIVKQFVGRDQK